MTSFELATHHQPHLAEGVTDLRAVMTVASFADANVEAEGDDAMRAVVLIGDRSKSMSAAFRTDSEPPVSRIAAMRVALTAAVQELADGTLFAIVAGDHRAEVLYPETGLAIASDETRAAACEAIAGLRAGGGTRMSRWLRAARRLFADAPDAIRLAILVTDGANEGDADGSLDEEIVRCSGLFQCECRGVGANWQLDELRHISSRLLGSVDMIRTPEQLTADFRSVIRRALDRTTSDVRLKVWVPTRAQLLSFGQVSPSVEDFAPHARLVDERTIEFPTGAWGEETRDYILSLRMDAGEIADEMLAARVSLLVGGDTVATRQITVEWSDNPTLVSQLNETVAHYTGQARLARAIRKGIAARLDGNIADAEKALGAAVQLAHKSGHADTLELLGRIVHIDDPASGTVRLRDDIDDQDEMELETRSTKTVRVRRDP